MKNMKLVLLFLLLNISKLAAQPEKNHISFNNFFTKSITSKQKNLNLNKRLVLPEHSLITSHTEIFCNFYSQNSMNNIFETFFF